jgi:hypothetical protein
MAAFEISELFLSEKQNRGMLFVCASSLQETAMAERSRKSRPTTVFRAKQSGDDELRRRLANSPPMNEGKFSASQSIENSETRKESRRGAPAPASGPAPARKWRRNSLKRLYPGPEMVWSRKPRTHKM